MAEAKTSKPKKTAEERLAALRQREAAIKADIARIENKAKTENRRLDTRRKIIVGAAVLAHAQQQPAFAEALRGALRAAVTKDADRALIADLL